MKRVARGQTAGPPQAAVSGQIQPPSPSMPGLPPGPLTPTRPVPFSEKALPRLCATWAQEVQVQSQLLGALNRFAHWEQDGEGFGAICRKIAPLHRSPDAVQSVGCWLPLDVAAIHDDGQDTAPGSAPPKRPEVHGCGFFVPAIDAVRIVHAVLDLSIPALPRRLSPWEQGMLASWVARLLLEMGAPSRIQVRLPGPDRGSAFKMGRQKPFGIYPVRGGIVACRVRLRRVWVRLPAGAGADRAWEEGVPGSRGRKASDTLRGTTGGRQIWQADWAP